MLIYRSRRVQSKSQLFLYRSFIQISEVTWVLLNLSPELFEQRASLGRVESTPATDVPPNLIHLPTLYSKPADPVASIILVVISWDWRRSSTAGVSAMPEAHELQIPSCAEPHRKKIAVRGSRMVYRLGLGNTMR